MKCRGDANPQTYLANHENLIRLGKLGKLLQRRHESLVIVPPPSRINKNDVVALLSSMVNGILGDGSSIFAVSLLVQLDFASFSGRQLLKVPHMHGELLDGARTESVAGGDEDLVLVLQQEEADLGQVGGLADAVDSDDGDDVGPSFAQRGDWWSCDGVDFAKKIEG